MPFLLIYYSDFDSPQGLTCFSKHNIHSLCSLSVTHSALSQEPCFSSPFIFHLPGKCCAFFIYHSLFSWCKVLYLTVLLSININSFPVDEVHFWDNTDFFKQHLCSVTVCILLMVVVHPMPMSSKIKPWQLGW